MMKTKLQARITSVVLFLVMIIILAWDGEEVPKGLSAGALFITVLLYRILLKPKEDKDINESEEPNNVWSGTGSDFDKAKKEWNNDDN